jgi:hypothetical protein
VFGVLSAFIFYVKIFIFRVTINKRRDLSVEEKLDVLKKYDELPKMSQRQAACKLKVS